jgi:hypothetical protein
MTVRGANYERKPNDDYPTPPEAIDILFEYVRFGAKILDPACGKLERIVEAAKRHGHIGTGRDIILGEDFLDSDSCDGHDIITNPPYGGRSGKLAREFIEHALALTEGHRGRVAMLLPVDFDSGKTRLHLFQHPAFALKLIPVDRIKWFNDKSGSINNAWYLWCWRHKGPPVLHYTRIPAWKV